MSHPQISLRGQQSPEYRPAHLEDVILPRFGLVFFNHLIGELDSFVGRAETNPVAYLKASSLKDIYVQKPGL